MKLMFRPIAKRLRLLSATSASKQTKCLFLFHFMGDNFQGALANQNPKVSLERDQTEQLHLKRCGYRDKTLCHSKKNLGLVSCGQLSWEVELGRGMNIES